MKSAAPIYTDSELGERVRVAEANVVQLAANHIPRIPEDSPLRWECTCGRTGDSPTSWRDHIRALLPESGTLLDAHDEALRRRILEHIATGAHDREVAAKARLSTHWPLISFLSCIIIGA